MSSSPPPLVTVTENGLYCPPGAFHIDPWRPVDTAVITHAHGDHLRHGSNKYLLAEPGAALARHRLGMDQHPQTLQYGERLQLGATTISLHPAGHILGSAQLRIEHDGRVWVVSGDYKRQPDPTCTAFEPQPCDVFISEATFALPIYQWQPTAQVVEEIFRWWRTNRERGLASVLFCYALGKAQRVLAELRAFTDESVYVHGAVGTLTDVYRRQGVDMLPTLPATGDRKTDYRGALIVAPPSAAGTPWMRRFGDHSLVTRALAEVTGIERTELAGRLMGDWQPGAMFWQTLHAAESPRTDPAVPYPFFSRRRWKASLRRWANAPTGRLNGSGTAFAAS